MRGTLCVASLFATTCFFPASPTSGQPVLKGYETQLVLDAPVQAGASAIVTGSGAPAGGGIWVELWRIPDAGGTPESLASAPAFGGSFIFEDVSIEEGDALFVTLSRSWQFNTDGDAEGWDQEVSPDANLEVSDGTLKVTFTNGNGDAFIDPFFQTFFDYDPAHYRVVEIRIKNSISHPGSMLGIFWGAPWGTTINEHNGSIPDGMEDFQTILFPMNVEEACIIPCANEGGIEIRDGLWDSGLLNNVLRVDPLNNLPADDPSFEGAVFEIDSIRIREDYRFDFHRPGDTQGLLVTHDMDDFDAEDGFLTYVAADVGTNTVPDDGPDGAVDPHFFSGLLTGRLDVSYFTRFALGTDNGAIAADPDIAVGIFFDDADSTGYWDDCPPPDCVPPAITVQEVNLLVGAEGRQDAAARMDDLRQAPEVDAGEWSEDGGRIPTSSLRLDCSQNATQDDVLRLDYFGWIPDTPYGPSDAVTVEAGTVATRLVLDAPIQAGGSQTITGSGAPEGDGIWVELWRIPAAGGVEDSLGSVQAFGGSYVFDDVSIAAGDVLYATLSRSWQFEIDGDPEGWDSILNDATVAVADGVLQVTIQNLNGDTFTDSFLGNTFTYDPSHYRVIEVRLRNPAPPVPTSSLGVFWTDTGGSIKFHGVPISSEMDDFQTFLIPMNVNEVRITPEFETGLDGIWDEGGLLNGTLRFDPLDGIPEGDPAFEGTVFEIDSIRIREDYVFEFQNDGDTQGLLFTNDIVDFDAVDGFLTYTSSDVGPNTGPEPVADGIIDPNFLSGLLTGALDTGYFRRLVLGMENGAVTVDPANFGIFFDDSDSTGYWDDCPPPDCVTGATTLQEANFSVSSSGRQDVSTLMSLLTGGEWVEDGGRIPTSSLRVDWPQEGTEGDRIDVDYYGWVPVPARGPSEPVVVEPGTEGVGPFLRGDCTMDGRVDITDGIFLLNFLFLGGPAPQCRAACDNNGKGILNITTAVYIFNFLFLGGPPPPPPHDECTTSSRLGDLEVGCENPGCP